MLPVMRGRSSARGGARDGDVLQPPLATCEHLTALVPDGDKPQLLRTALLQGLGDDLCPAGGGQAQEIGRIVNPHRELAAVSPGQAGGGFDGGRVGTAVPPVPWGVVIRPEVDVPTTRVPLADSTTYRHRQRIGLHTQMLRLTSWLGRPARRQCSRRDTKIKLSGRLSGKRCSREPVRGLRALVCARVLPGQALCLR